MDLLISSILYNNYNNDVLFTDIRRLYSIISTFWQRSKIIRPVYGRPVVISTKSTSFLDSDYSLNSVPTQIHCSTELASIPPAGDRTRDRWMRDSDSPTTPLRIYGSESWELAKYIRGLVLSHVIFLARLLDHEETWKYTNGSGWC